jgi:hypothetical protein
MYEHCILGASALGCTEASIEWMFSQQCERTDGTVLLRVMRHWTPGCHDLGRETRCRGDEPLSVVRCNKLASRARSKLSRWRETTRAERDRPCCSGRPNGCSNAS